MGCPVRPPLESKEFPGSVLHPNEVSVPAAVSGRNLKVSDRRAKCDTGMTGASKQQCSLSWFEMDSEIKETKYEKI